MGTASVPSNRWSPAASRATTPSHAPRFGPKPFRELTFVTIDEAWPDRGWALQLARLWPSYRTWHLSRGYYGRPSRERAEAALAEHMPELVPVARRLVELGGDSAMLARFVPLWQPPPYILGGSQAVRTQGEPILVRSYDYSAKLTDGLILRTRWGERQVIAMADLLWGCLDGINDRGLVVSLVFGGRRVLGQGFAIPLILRYLLEAADTAAQAAVLLARLPSHMAYTVTVCDAAGDHVTAMLSPDRVPRVGKASVVTNHQGEVEWYKHARATASVERERQLISRLGAGAVSDDELIDAFFHPPVYSREFATGFGTQYTAVYRPRRGQLTLHWPGASWTLSFDDFLPARRRVTFR